MANTASRARHSAPIEELDRRYERAIESAHYWKDVTGGTNQQLARLIPVHCSSITNFLNRKPGYEPRPSRPAMMRILGKLEAVCARPDAIRELDVGAVRRRHPDDDERLYVCDHALRLRTLRCEPDLAHALARSRDVCLQAEFGPQAHRQLMCHNALLTLASRVDKPSSRRVPPDVLTATAERARRLQRAAADPSLPLHERHDPVATAALAGHVLAHVGLLVGDRDLVDEGMGAFADAVSRPHRTGDGVWANALMTLEHLLAADRATGRSWSRRLAERARAALADDTLLDALREKRLPRVREHWNQIAADVIAADVLQRPSPEDAP